MCPAGLRVAGGAGRNDGSSHTYLITSDRDADPATPAAWVRGHSLRAPAARKTGTPGSAAVVEGHLIAVGVGERESAAERPVGGR
jgi:hypothetical protein